MTSNTRKFPSSPEEEICITGISGEFPNSKNINEFEYNLYNKIDMVDGASIRWSTHQNSSEIPKRMGNIGTLAKFDAQFFGIHFKQVNSMDPQGRMLIEKAYEAILDAGIHPKTLRGTRTGVYVGASFVESEYTCLYEKIVDGGFGLTGCSRSMLANRISYALDLHGPSVTIDTACSSSMYSLDFAFSAMRNGEIDAAIVGGVNLLMCPSLTLQFARLGVLDKDGDCRPFDVNSSGYARSETICAILLQKAKDSKRVYAKVVYSKTNSDGYKAEGITYPSNKGQQRLLSEFYRDINIDPTKIQFVEAHSTGTIVGDPEECVALSSVFCKNRKEPLLVGAVKSNMGHSESASSMCSIAKVMLACDRSEIAPNINFTSIRKGVKSLEENQLRVCTEITKLTCPLIGISAFGFGGASAHVLLSKYGKGKVNNGLPRDNIPRLVTWSGRTEDGVAAVFEAISNIPLDVEFIALLHNIQSVDEPGFIYRGYSIMEHQNGSNAVSLESSTRMYTESKRPIIFMFSGMGSQWNGMGKSLMQLSRFKSSIDKCHTVLQPFGVDLLSIITTDDTSVFDSALNAFVGIVAIQIGIVDILKELDISPDYIIGHSMGEIACGYCDGALSLEEAILAAYYRGFASISAKHLIPRGAMAAIGKGYKDIKCLLPENVEVACRNSSTSCTISGLEKSVHDFIKQMETLKIFVKEVNSTGIPYHTGLIKEIGRIMFAELENVLPHPRKRSSKWISTSVPKHSWSEAQHQFASANYYTNNLLGTVLFEEGVAELPDQSIMLEVGPHGLLQAIVKKSMPYAIHIPLTRKGHPNNLSFFLGAIGKLYMNGQTMPIQKLYPEIQFPVSRRTPKISPLMKWQHNENWFVSNFSEDVTKSGERKFKISIDDDELLYLTGHQVDGRCFFPASGLLVLVWQTYAGMNSLIYTDMDVEFEDIRILRAIHLIPKNELKLTVMIHYGTGRFEISEKSLSVATGIIRQVLPKMCMLELPPIKQDKCPVLTEKDFYRELRLRGYQYNMEFRSVTEVRADGMAAKIKWNNNWVAFIDSALQTRILLKDSRSLYLPTRIRKVRINPQVHLKSVDPKNSMIALRACLELGVIQAGGLEAYDMTANPISRRNVNGNKVHASYNFIPHRPTPLLHEQDALRLCCQLALENGLKTKLSALEIHTTQVEPIIDKLWDVLLEIPQVKADLYLMTNTEANIDMNNVTIIQEKWDRVYSLILAYESSKNLQLLAEASKSLLKGGFLISRESQLNVRRDIKNMGFNVIAEVQVHNSEYLVLLQKVNRKPETNSKVIYVSSNDMQFKWIDDLKENIGKAQIILVADNDQFSGLLGFVNCLRKESDFSSVRMVYINDRNAPIFSLDNAFYIQQLNHGWAINIYQNGKWGTYRHLALFQENNELPQYGNCYASLLRKGDLSSISWVQGPSMLQKKNVACVQYASLNFRDVMLATGKLSLEDVHDSRFKADNLIGIEFSGIDREGHRIMGMSQPGSLSTFAEYENTMIFAVPDSMSLEEAATIPTVYLTVYYAFFMYNSISSGKSILIHAGSGGVGLAAIRVALAYKMEVFTTVSNETKKKFVLDQFPILKESHIGNSRDCSFENMIKVMTNGKGVDFVLNSLSEDKLKASIRCLAHLGTFLEIGKFDMANNNEIGLESFMKELTFRSVMADNFETLDPFQQKKIRDLIEKDLKSGIIKPLPATIFSVNEIEKAFRFLSSGKHMGKIIVKIRSDPFDKCSVPIKSLPRCYFDANKVYIVAGGLGGFGMELSDWMILRGARKIVLISRKGVTNGYQKLRISWWKSYGCQVIISSSDITTLEGCQAMFRESMKYGQIDGIFNLAAVLRDGTIVSQNCQTFLESMAPKAAATKYLDQLSRMECPEISYFVVFSSVACGQGNAGQTNYGMANSVMERVVEKRALDGLSGKAIQWGAIGEVGLVAELTNGRSEIEIAGTLQQPVSSCLIDLDILLSTPDPIVQCMITAEKTLKSSKPASIIDCVMNIMGIQDFKSIPIGVTLSDLGMDSLMATEILQTLEREFDLTIPVGELRSMTLFKLNSLSENVLRNIDNDSSTNVQQIENNLIDLKRLLENRESSEKLFYPISSRDEHKTTSCLIFMHGIEGVNVLWNKLAMQIDMPTYMVNFADHMESIQDLADTVFLDIMDVFKFKKHFYIVAYSFGSIVALEIVRRLEASKKQGQIIFVDTSPTFIRKLVLQYVQSTDSIESNLQIKLASSVVKEMIPTEDMKQLQQNMSNYPSWPDKLNQIAKVATSANYDFNQSIRLKCTGLYKRLKAILQTSWLEHFKIQSPITLIRSRKILDDTEEDYGLSRYTEGQITIKFINGSHQTILQNPELANMINQMDPNMQTQGTMPIDLDSKQ